MKQVHTDSLSKTYVEPKEELEYHGIKYDPEKHYVFVDDTGTDGMSQAYPRLRRQGYVVEHEVMDKMWWMSCPKKMFEDRVAAEQRESASKREPKPQAADQIAEVRDGNSKVTASLTER